MGEGEKERGNVAPQYGSLARDHDTVTLMTLTRTFQCRVQSANSQVIVSQTLSSPEVANIFWGKAIRVAFAVFLERL